MNMQRLGLFSLFIGVLMVVSSGVAYGGFFDYFKSKKPTPEVAAKSVDTSAAKVGIQSFDTESFDAALATDKTVVLDYHATWCGTCRTQGRVITELLKEPELNDIVVFRVNYDENKALKKLYNVTYQSTLVLFENGKVSRRVVGETQKSKLRDFLKG